MSTAVTLQCALRYRPLPPVLCSRAAGISTWIENFPQGSFELFLACAILLIITAAAIGTA